MLNPDYKYSVEVCIDVLDPSGMPETLSETITYSLMDLYRFSLTNRLERELDALKERLLQKSHMVVLAVYYLEEFDDEQELEQENGLKAFEVPSYLRKLKSMMSQHGEFDD